MGVGSYLHSRNKAIQIVGAQPAEGSQIPGIRKWPEAYQPSIYRPNEVDCFELISQTEAEDMARRLAAEEGIFGGITSARSEERREGKGCVRTCQFRGSPDT